MRKVPQLLTALICALVISGAAAESPGRTPRAPGIPKSGSPPTIGTCTNGAPYCCTADMEGKFMCSSLADVCNSIIVCCNSKEGSGEQQCAAFGGAETIFQ